MASRKLKLVAFVVFLIGLVLTLPIAIAQQISIPDERVLSTMNNFAFPSQFDSHVNFVNCS